MTTQKTKMGTGSLILIISTILILIVINVYSYRHFGRVDLTANKEYTLSESSKNIMQRLDDVITIKAYFSNAVEKAEELIRRGKLVVKSDQEIATWAFLHEKKNPIIICAVCSIRENIKSIAEYGIKFAVSAIDRSFIPK